jgi:hypothetical protein
MRIASVEVVPYALPFREPYTTATGTLERREMALLRLRSEEGLTGLGEAVPLSLRGGTGLSRVVEELERLGERESLDEATLRGRCRDAVRPGPLRGPDRPARPARTTGRRGGRLDPRARAAGALQRDPDRRRPRVGSFAPTPNAGPPTASRPSS